MWAILKKLLSHGEKKMVISDEVCIQRLEVNEGLKLEPYRCPAGKLTIGIGRNLDGNPLSKEEKAYIGHDCRSQKITKDQAYYLCRNDLKQVRKDLDRELPWWRDLSANRQFVMIDLCFNMGYKTLLTFQKTLNSIAQGFYITAGDQLMQSKYAKQTGIRARRNEYALKTDDWVTNPPKEF